MIFTVGHRESYEIYFREYENPEKLGRHDNYPGGSVWLTFEEAQQHCPEGYAVYGVEAVWGKDTEQNVESDCHDLLTTSKLVKLK